MAQDKHGLRRGSTEAEALEKEAILRHICNELHPTDKNNVPEAKEGGRARASSSNSKGDGRKSSGDDTNSETSSSNSVQDPNESHGAEGFDNDNVVTSSRPTSSRKRKDAMVDPASLASLSSILKSFVDFKTDDLITRKKQAEVENARLQSENARLQAERDHLGYLKSLETRDNLHNAEIIGQLKLQTSLLMTLINRLSRFGPQSLMDFTSHSPQQGFDVGVGMDPVAHLGNFREPEVAGMFPSVLGGPHNLTMNQMDLNARLGGKRRKVNEA